MSGCKAWLGYETVQIVRIKNWKLGVIHIGIQLLIIGYVIGFSLIYKKAYQGTGEIIGSTDIKVKGTAFTNASDGSVTVWDATDLIYPYEQPDAFFLATNMWVTLNQTQGLCVSYAADSQCNSTWPCRSNFVASEGVQTGQCLNGYCQVHSWCPIENETLSYDAGLSGVQNFTVFIRMNVRFPSYEISRDNTQNGIQPSVNLWTLARIVDMAGYKYDGVRLKGAVVAFIANWDCDFDSDVSKCVPTVAAFRLDDPKQAFTSGYNFRKAEYFKLADGTPSRDLYKLYGVRVAILTSGIGKKFDTVPLFTALGAGLGLLTVATLVSDFIALKLMGKRSANYNKMKVVTYNDPIEISDEDEVSPEEIEEEDTGVRAVNSSDETPSPAVPVHVHATTAVTQTQTQNYQSLARDDEPSEAHDETPALRTRTSGGGGGVKRSKTGFGAGSDLLGGHQGHVHNLVDARGNPVYVDREGHVIRVNSSLSNSK